MSTDSHNVPANMLGVWHLVLGSDQRAEADLDDPHHDLDGNGAWMRTSGRKDLAAAAPVSGLTLTISASGDFTEEGESSVSLFDAHGVETAGEPFAGRLALTALGMQAFTDPRQIPATVQSIADTSVLRCSDGDTDISEIFEVVDDRLVRTQNVVTDGIYLARVTLIYAREPSNTPDPGPEHADAVLRAGVVASDDAALAAERKLVELLIAGAPPAWQRLVAYVSVWGRRAPAPPPRGHGVRSRSRQRGRAQLGNGQGRRRLRGCLSCSSSLHARPVR